MATEAVSLDPFQNISNVGWGKDFWLLIFVAHAASNNSVSASSVGSVSIVAPDGLDFQNEEGAITPADTNTTSSGDVEGQQRTYTITQADIDAGVVSWSHHFVEDISADFGDYIGSVRFMKITGKGSGEAVITVDFTPNGSTADLPVFSLARGLQKDMVLSQTVEAFGVTGPEGLVIDALENFVNTIPGGTGEPTQYQFTISLDAPRVNNP